MLGHNIKQTLTHASLMKARRVIVVRSRSLFTRRETKKKRTKKEKEKGRRVRVRVNQLIPSGHARRSDAPCHRTFGVAAGVLHELLVTAADDHLVIQIRRPLLTPSPPVRLQSTYPRTTSHYLFFSQLIRMIIVYILLPSRGKKCNYRIHIG